MCAFYAAHGWDFDALEEIAGASPLRKMFLDHAREQYYEEQIYIIRKALSYDGGDVNG